MRTHDRPDLSIIICTRNRSRSVLACLEELARSDIRCSGTQTVVVDNASTDDTAAVVSDWSASVSDLDVTVVHEPRVGLSFARNAGMRAASGEALFFTDDDCRVPRDLVATLRRVLATPGTAMVAGNLLEPDDSHLRSRRGRARVMQPGSVLRAGDALGACMAFRREVIETIGQFDEAFGAGARWRCEDADYMQRGLRAGFALTITPELYVRHRHDRLDPASARAAVLDNDYARGAYHAKHGLWDLRHLWLLLYLSARIGPREPRRAMRQLRGAADYWAYRASLRGHRESGMAIAWTSRPARSRDLARVLGYRSAVVRRPPWLPVPAVPVFYLCAAVRSGAALLRQRPGAVLVQHPPIVPAVMVMLYARARGIPYFVDGHPSSFGLKNDRLHRFLLPVTRKISERAVATLVTVQELADLVDSWGGNGIVFHEPPPVAEPTAPPPLTTPMRVLVASVFGLDEPIEEMLAVADRLPDVLFHVTGRPTGRRLANAGPNVVATGLLSLDAYMDLLRTCHVVVSLSKEPQSVMRSAYEAVFQQRVLVTSDWPGLRRALPLAVFTANTARAVEAALVDVREDYAAHAQRAVAAAQLARETFRAQLSALGQGTLNGSAGRR
ncbi:MAG: hypothetical protein JWP62_3799 [Blastococcus sp.]|jgi:GT2 family glycosyltransferase|nr:hypothetical protein [Blastococcus sp.]